MGDNVIDDAQVIFEISTDDADFTAGGDTGKIILDSVTITIDRETRGYSGIGNEAETGVGYGTRSASMSTTTHLNQAAAEALDSLYNNARTPQEVSVLAGDVIDSRASKMDWNSLEVDVQDDGDVTASIDAKLRGLEIEANP